METNSKNYEKAIYALEKTQLEIAKLDRKARSIFFITEIVLFVFMVAVLIVIITS